MYENLLAPSQGFTFFAGKRNYLLFIAKNAASLAEPLLHEIQQCGLPYEHYELHEGCDLQAIGELLSRRG